MNQKKIERNSLIVSAVVNFIMAAAGVTVFFVTKLQSLFLDGFFSFIAFLSTIMAVVFSKVSNKKNKTYPTGMYFLEPLYGVVKAVLTFVLLISATLESSATAIDYFFKGVGNPIQIDVVLPYSLLMVVMCFGLSFYNRKQNKKINNVSTMLTAEANSNVVDGIISGGVGLLILLLKLVPLESPFRFLHYTGDFFITIMLVAISVKEPISTTIMSFRELTSATIKDETIKTIVRNIVRKEIKEENIDNKFEIYKIGKHIKVVILLSENLEPEVLQRLKTDCLREIKSNFQSVTVEYVYRKISDKEEIKQDTDTTKSEIKDTELEKIEKKEKV